MNNIVKDFIEENINYIEKEQWLQLFLAWYDNPYKSYPDTQYSELMIILSSCYKDIDARTLPARTMAITVAVGRTLDTITKPNSGWLGNEVYQEFLLADLVSALGLSKQELIECIDAAANSEHLDRDIDEDGDVVYTWEN